MDRPHTEFALALHRQLPATGNVCWSPYSVAAALGLAAAGAAGDTYAELAGALAPGGALRSLVKRLTASASLPDAQAAVANSLWLARALVCHADYQRQVRELPGGAVHQVDFRADPEGARREINQDVAETTRGLIPDLIGAGQLSPETAAVIVNALYLRVAWLAPFVPEATSEATFHARSGDRPVPMLRQQESFPYAAADGWQLASLPTASTVVVDVLLPPPGVDEIPADLLARLQGGLRPRKLDLALPRLRLAQAAELNTPLQRLGVVAAFDRHRADFSGITGTERLFIDLVLHKAVLRVDEQGFEGAAATAVVMRAVSMDLSEPTPFYLDRPFLLLIRHRKTGAIYFLAKVDDPAG